MAALAWTRRQNRGWRLTIGTKSGCETSPGASRIMDMVVTNPSLIQRVRDPDDHASWQEFVELYRPLLAGYVRSRGVNSADAETLVQDIIVKLWQSMANFNYDAKRGRFRTWLWQVTVNAISDFFRARKKQPPGFDGEPAEIGNVADDAQPDAEWIGAHRRRVLEVVLPKVRDKTQPRTWYCFEQHVLKGRTGAELAAELQLTPNAVIVNACRTLEKVRALCAEYMEELDDD